MAVPISSDANYIFVYRRIGNIGIRRFVKLENDSNHGYDFMVMLVHRNLLVVPEPKFDTKKLIILDSVWH